MIFGTKKTVWPENKILVETMVEEQVEFSKLLFECNFRKERAFARTG